MKCETGTHGVESEVENHPEHRQQGDQEVEAVTLRLEVATWRQRQHFHEHLQGWCEHEWHARMACMNGMHEWHA